VSLHASGTFDVKLNPEASDTPAEGSALGRLSIAKEWHGDVEGTSAGVMLTASSNEKNSAGYVAVERVTGTLRGRAGTFALQHSGTMNRGAPTLVITVVPDSGTGALLGMTGTLKIIIEDGKHAYELDYTLPPSS